MASSYGKRTWFHQLVGVLSLIAMITCILMLDHKPCQIPLLPREELTWWTHKLPTTIATGTEISTKLLREKNFTSIAEEIERFIQNYYDLLQIYHLSIGCWSIVIILLGFINIVPSKNEDLRVLTIVFLVLIMGFAALFAFYTAFVAFHKPCRSLSASDAPSSFTFAFADYFPFLSSSSSSSGDTMESINNNKTYTNKNNYNNNDYYNNNKENISNFQVTRYNLRKMFQYLQKKKENKLKQQELLASSSSSSSKNFISLNNKSSSFLLNKDGYDNNNNNHYGASSPSSSIKANIATDNTNNINIINMRPSLNIINTTIIRTSTKSNNNKKNNKEIGVEEGEEEAEDEEYRYFSQIDPTSIPYMLEFRSIKDKRPVNVFEDEDETITRITLINSAVGFILLCSDFLFFFDSRQHMIEWRN